MAKIKGKDNILEAAREGQTVNYKRKPIKLLGETIGQKTRNIQSSEREERSTTNDTMPSKIIIQN